MHYILLLLFIENLPVCALFFIKETNKLFFLFQVLFFWLDLNSFHDLGVTMVQ